jgi:hypothetical protein
VAGFLADGAGKLLDSGTRLSTSLDPEIWNLVLPSKTNLPAAVTRDCFIVNPFFAMASCNCLRVTVLPGFNFTVARPLSKLTSTERTPFTDITDTRTACAQTSQSIPKIVMSMVRISAREGMAEKTVNSKNKIDFFTVVPPSVNAERANS